MAGGKAGFLIGESGAQTGDLVLYLRSESGITDRVGIGADARIFPGHARQGAELPYLTYNRVQGHVRKTLVALDGGEDLVLNIYAWGASQGDSEALAQVALSLMINTLNRPVGDGTIIHVCNGGIIDDGTEAAKDSSDRKKYWTRMALRLVISD